MQEEVARLAAEAQQQADAQLAEAASQMEWTQTTVAALLDGAKADVAHRKHQSHLDQARRAAELRAKLAATTQRSVDAARRRLRSAEVEADDVRGRADAELTAATQHAHRARAEAGQQAADTIERAQREAQAIVQRAEERISEAEASAARLREQLMAELERSQQASYERTRANREEAVKLLQDARIEAETIRTQAREMLTAARDEVAGLTKRRDAITLQLNSLSGVIEALAVPNTTQEEDES